MSEWTIEFDGWDPDDEPRREALCALGNGFVVTRGAAEEYAAGGAHYPGTYLAGGYDRADGRIDGETVVHEDLVNWPNWLPLTFRPDADDGEWLDPDRWTILEYRRALDLQRGLLVRRLRVRDPAGRVTALRSRRLVHMGNPRLLAMEWELTPENWSGAIIVRSALDGTVENANVAHDAALEHDHLRPLAQSADDGVLSLLVEARQSRLRVALAAVTRVYGGGRAQPPARTTDVRPGWAAEELRLTTGSGRALRIEKVVALCTSRDRGLGEPGEAARRLVCDASDFAELLRTHVLAWRRLWRRGDITVAGAPEAQQAQQALRLHAFHLLQTASPHTADLDTGIPARGWHGEAYRGHVSWDGLFAFPYLALRFPEVARALLLHRWRRLGEARRRAREAGHRGALFPWRSGSDGREETPRRRRDARTGRWRPDHGRLQYHVNGAIAFDVWRYYEATGDLEFLSAYGAELVVATARFWSSLATLDASDDRYHLRGVVGPDEYHDAYPDAAHPGIDDDAYTAVMAAWTLRCAERILALLPPDRAGELCDRLAVSADERARWHDVGRRLALPFLADGLLAPFAGWEALAELDWATLRAQHGDLHDLDAILAAEGDTTNRYRVSKLAGVLVLLHLFSERELEELIRSLGYAWSARDVPRTVTYYLERTTQGSALSATLHRWVLARTDRAGSWSVFEQALGGGAPDVQGGTTAQGIHLGAMAATLDLVQRCYLGLELRDGVLHLAPRLPEPLRELCVTLRHRGQWLSLRATPTTLTVRCREGLHAAAHVAVGGERAEIGVREERVFEIEGVGRRA